VEKKGGAARGAPRIFCASSRKVCASRPKRPAKRAVFRRENGFPGGWHTKCLNAIQHGPAGKNRLQDRVKQTIERSFYEHKKSEFKSGRDERMAPGRLHAGERGGPIANGGDFGHAEAQNGQPPKIAQINQGQIDVRLVGTDYAGIMIGLPGRISRSRAKATQTGLGNRF